MTPVQPSTNSWQRPVRTLTALAAGAVLAGCASFSPDGGFDRVAQTTRERIGKDVVWQRDATAASPVAERVTQLLAKPLDVDSAVQLALFNNRGLQASFFELGISEADLVQAGTFPNPRFAGLRASKLEPNGVREWKIEQALTWNVFSLVTLPQALAIEQRRFEQTQRRVSEQVLRLGADVRKAYFTAVAAQESARYARQVMQAAEAGAELARRMAQVGNFNRLQQAREQGFYADAALNLARAQQAHTAARERLTRLLGLWGAQAAFRLPERLPDLPIAATELANAEQLAMAQRLDLQAMRIELDALARNLGLTRSTRLLNVLEFGPARVLEGVMGAQVKTGYEISLDIPLFDWGTARVAKAEAIYMQAVSATAQAAVEARSEVREAYSEYRSAYDIARHQRQEVVPIRKRISEENQLRYNGMLIGVFELLADARAQISSVNASIESLRDFWIAQTDLDMALVGKGSAGPQVRARMEAAQAEAGH